MNGWQEFKRSVRWLYEDFERDAHWLIVLYGMTVLALWGLVAAFR